MVDRVNVTPLLCAALGAAAGFYFPAFVSLNAAAAAVTAHVFALCFFRVLASLLRTRGLQITSFCVTAFASGLVLGICASAAGNVPFRPGMPEDKITAIEGVLLDDPRVISGGMAAASVSLRRSSGASFLRVNAGGVVTVFFSRGSVQRLKDSGRGTVILAEGKLRPVGNGYTFGADSLHVLKRAPAVERMRTAVRAGIASRLDGKSWGGLALALLLGIKDNLDTNLAASYRDSGCSYILALSGMHLAVIAGLIAFLLKRPLGLKKSAVTGAVIICLYCFLVGPLPSLNRAALMYLLTTAAILGALPKKPASILALSFLIQIVITPGAGNSISFILSYLALAGILAVGQPLYSIAKGNVPDFLLKPLTASAGAFLATAGVTGFVFGRVAPIGIAAGLALVPLTTVFMTGSMLWLLFDAFSLSGPLDLPLSLLCQLMDKIVSLAGSVPPVSPANPAVILEISLAIPLLIAALEYKRRAALLRPRPFP